MKLKSRLTASILALAAGTAAFAQGTGTVNEGQTLIPQRAIILHGDPSRADSSVIAVFYSRENLDFSDADAPRFMLLDRDGKIAFGIGGSLYATASYDFGGSIDDYNFTTYDIQVPNNAEFRQRFGQNGRQAVIQLDGHHLFGPAAQLRSKHPEARPDLQHPYPGGGAAQLRHAGADAGIDDEILAERMGKGKPVALQQLLDDGGVGESGHSGLLNEKSTVSISFPAKKCNT